MEKAFRFKHTKMETLLSQINQSIVDLNIDFENKIEQIKLNKTILKEKFEILKSKLPLFIEALKEQSLELVDLRNGKTDIGCVRLTPEIKLSYIFSGKSIDGKFKFLKSGDRNQDALSRKANKMEKRFKEIAGVDCHVNRFSLEKKENKEPSVIFEVWL